MKVKAIRFGLKGYDSNRRIPGVGTVAMLAVGKEIVGPHGTGAQRIVAIEYRPPLVYIRKQAVDPEFADRSRNWSNNRLEDIKDEERADLLAFPVDSDCALLFDDEPQQQGQQQAKGK